MALTAQQVQQFYIGYYGRPADPVGLTFWQTQTEAQALTGFAGSAEFTNQFTGLSTSQQVTKVYGNLLGRTPDVAGLLYWSGEITAGRETIGSLVLSMIKNALGKDVTTIADRVTYSTAFTTALDTTEEVNAYSGATATQTARDALLKVIATAVGDHTALNTETAKIDATIATIVSGGSTNPGQTFTLTAGVDNIVGTSGNDTIIGGAGSAGGTSTLGAADVINGGAGTDTLQVSLEGAGATVSPNLTSVEIIKAQALGTGGATVNMVNATGATALMNNNSTDALSFTNVQALAAVHLVKGDATKTTTVSFIDSLVAGTSDAVSVVLDGAKAATLSVAGTSAGGFETVNVTALAGKSVVGTLQSNFTANAGTKTINIDGAGSVKLSDIAATVTTINASANTGGADVHIDAGTSLDVTFTGGSGDDQLRMEDTLTTLDKLDGGAGRDTIHVTNGAALVDGLQVTNFELLDVAAATGTYNMSKLAGIDTLVVSNSTAGAVTVNNLAKGAKVVLGGENTAAALINVGGLAINVKDSGAGSANDVIDVAINSKVGVTTGGDVTIANIETVNFTASSVNTGVTHSLSGQTVLAHALTINANADTANLTIADLDALALVSFDASASVKNVSVTTGADTFTATGGTAFKFGAGNDTLVLTGAVGGSTGVDFVINGGKGGDTITLAAAGQVEVLVYAAGDSQAGVVAGVNQFDTVTNFKTTEDKINLASLGFSGSAVATIKVGAAGDISTTTGAVNANKMANFFGAGGDMRAVVTVDDGANTWVYVDANKDGSFQADSDLVIALMGVTGVAVPVAGDFVFAA